MKSTRKKVHSNIGRAKQVSQAPAKPVKPSREEIAKLAHQYWSNRSGEQGNAVTAEAIAGLADDGKDVSRYFTNKGRMMEPIQRVNVDFAAPMLQELDNAARELNISRQAVIKTLLRQALDQHYLAAANQRASAPGAGIRRA